jgi:hypothetical protein
VTLPIIVDACLVSAEFPLKVDELADLLCWYWLGSKAIGERIILSIQVDCDVYGGYPASATYGFADA